MRLAIALVLVLGACGKKGASDAEKQQLAFRKTAVQIHLVNMQKNLEAYYAEFTKFRVGNAGPTPSAACCTTADHKCPASSEWGTDPVWSQVHYAVTEPGYFQYSYEGAADGRSATLTATGDLDCDGTPIVFRVLLTAGPSGANVSSEKPALDAF